MRSHGCCAWRRLPHTEESDHAHFLLLQAPQLLFRRTGEDDEADEPANNLASASKTSLLIQQRLQAACDGGWNVVIQGVVGRHRGAGCPPPNLSARRGRRRSGTRAERGARHRCAHGSPRKGSSQRALCSRALGSQPTHRPTPALTRPRLLTSLSQGSSSRSAGAGTWAEGSKPRSPQREPPQHRAALG